MVESIVEEEKLGSYFTALKVKAPLTKNKISEFMMYPGEAYLSIGVKEIDKGPIKVWVDKDETLNWHCLDILNTKYRNGYLIRSIYYTGNDLSFLKWSENRKVYFTWHPLEDENVDLTNSKIEEFHVNTDKKLTVKLGENQRNFTYTGKSDNLCVKDLGSVYHLILNIDNDKSLESCKLPHFGKFNQLERLVIYTNPNGCPLDCNSILQFKEIENLSLIGNFTNLEVLKEFTNLKELGFWDAPNLEGLPPISIFKDLTYFCARNIMRDVGINLRKEVNKLKKTNNMDFASVSSLRDEEWFKSEYGIPFNDWENGSGKKATQIYRKCLEAVKKAKTETELKTAVVEYTGKMNKLKNIESTERDDIYSALELIMKNAKVKIDSDIWFNWFEEFREF